VPKFKESRYASPDLRRQLFTGAQRDWIDYGVLMQEGNQMGLGAIGGGAETFFGKNKGKSVKASWKSSPNTAWRPSSCWLSP
jgi:hypothetical protein